MKLLPAVAAVVVVVAITNNPADSGAAVGEAGRSLSGVVDGFVEGLLVFGDNLGDDQR